MDIVEFLQIEFFSFYQFGLVVGFPDLEGLVRAGKHIYQVWFSGFDIGFKLLCGVSLEIAHNCGDIRCLNNHVHVVQHENKAMNFQPSVVLQIDQAVGQNVPAIVPVKNVIPIPHCWCYKVQPGFFVNMNSCRWHYTRLNSRCPDCNYFA